MNKQKSNEKPIVGEIVLYQPDDSIRLEVMVDDETVWLMQGQMVELFQTTKQNVSLHINNAIKEGEIEPWATVKEYLTVQNEGERKVSRIIKRYNLELINEELANLQTNKIWIDKPHNPMLN